MRILSDSFVKPLLSSGRTDYGANLLLAKHVSGQALYVNVVQPAVPVSPTTRGSSLIVQQRTQSSVFAKATASDLSSLSHQLTVGIRTPIDRHLEWVVAFTENYGTFKSSPDIGVHLSVARRL